MARKDRERFEFTMDKYTDGKLQEIMDSGLFLTKAEAIKAIIIEFANKLEKSEKMESGREVHYK